MSLFIDVPLFFFLTGCTFSIIKIDGERVFKQMYKLLYYFFFLVMICQFFSLNFSLEQLLQPIFFQSAQIKVFPVVEGSYWFVPQYIVAIIFSYLAIRYTPKLIPVWIFLAFSYYAISWFLDFKIKGFVLGVPTQSSIFYIGVLLLGFSSYTFKKCKLWLFASSVLSIVSFLLFRNTGFVLQQYKFPVALPYVTISLLSISILMSLYNERKVPFLQYLWSNAILFYMSQGISSSIIYLLVPHLNFHWSLNLLIAFITNFSLSMIIGCSMKIINDSCLRMKSAKYSDPNRKIPRF